MRTTCWCGYTREEHSILLAHHFDNTEATYKAYCEMYKVAKKDYDNKYSMWQRFKSWLWK